MIYIKKKIKVLYLVLFIFSLSLILLISIILIGNYKISSYEFLNGVWSGKKNNEVVTFLLEKNNKCILKIKDIGSAEYDKVFTGICNINFNKNPITLSMNQIIEKNYSLYMIIKIVNKSTIKMSKFSNKWRLRPIVFEDINTIILKK
tara:strand:+ start:168 stop:608 length:441 start_codon:yes stop_codon:yes gene_type:complete